MIRLRRYGLQPYHSGTLKPLGAPIKGARFWTYRQAMQAAIWHNRARHLERNGTFYYGIVKR